MDGEHNLAECPIGWARPAAQRYMTVRDEIEPLVALGALCTLVYRHGAGRGADRRVKRAS